MSKCRCVGGLEDAWEEIQGTGGGETCGTPQNTYWYCCHIGIFVVLLLLFYSSKFQPKSINAKMNP